MIKKMVNSRAFLLAFLIILLASVSFVSAAQMVEKDKDGNILIRNNPVITPEGKSPSGEKNFLKDNWKIILVLIILTALAVITYFIIKRRNKSNKNLK